MLRIRREQWDAMRRSRRLAARRAVARELRELLLSELGRAPDGEDLLRAVDQAYKRARQGRLGAGELARRYVMASILMELRGLEAETELASILADHELSPGEKLDRIEELHGAKEH